jgi:hypothetical protein
VGFTGFAQHDPIRPIKDYVVSATVNKESNGELTPDEKPYARESMIIPAMVVAFVQHMQMRPEAAAERITVLKGPYLSAKMPGRIRPKRLEALMMDTI